MALNDIQRIDRNFLLHATRIPELTAGMQVFDDSHLSYADSSLSCDTFNIIHITGPELEATTFKAAVQHFRARDMAYCIWVNDENESERVRQYFSDLGIQAQGQEIGMTLDLPNYEPIAAIKHQHIVQVSNPQQLRDYASVIAENWTPPDVNVLRYYELTASHYLNDAHGVILLVYYQHGKPVATVELFPSDRETIGVYGLATLEDTRGQGIGSALMTYALNVARQSGYKKVVLQASEDGMGIYQRLGFRAQTKYLEYS